MSDLPWKVPVTDEGRERLIELAKEYRATGARRELGATLASLAHVVKHVGTASGNDAFLAAGNYGAEAVEILRQVGDKAELARALRLAAVPFVQPAGEAMLEESLALAREIGDRDQEAEVLFVFALRSFERRATFDDALALYIESGSIIGQAQCYLMIGFRREVRNADLCDRAAEMYESIGETESADRARMLAKMAREPIEDE